MITNTTPQKSAPKTSRRLVAAIVAGGVAIAGLTAAVTMTLETPNAHAQSTHQATSSAGSTSQGGSSAHGGSSTHHSHQGHHAVTPSQSTKTLQSQLAQLNYYNGPISGCWNSETTNAVDYLQASAQLPQTGTIDTATQAALDYQLAHGDNQMGN